MRILNVLNLGAGIGSTTVYIMMHRGEIPLADCAIFADTQEEPRPVYDHLQWLLTLNHPKIIVATAGKLGNCLIGGVHSAGQISKSGNRFAAIPAFTAPHHEDRESLVGCEKGKTKRQCTSEFKIKVVERVIRREVLGLKHRQRIPKDVLVRQHFGLSDDENIRIRKVKERYAGISWGEPVFPLAKLGMHRDDCINYLRQHVPHAVPRSACTFCPYRDAEGWLWLKEHDPEGWQRALEIDRAIRDPRSIATRGMRQSLYLHKSCVPLEQVDIEAEAAELRRKKQTGQLDLFRVLDTDCMAGMCGL